MLSSPKFTCKTSRFQRICKYQSLECGKRHGGVLEHNSGEGNCESKIVARQWGDIFLPRHLDVSQSPLGSLCFAFVSSKSRKFQARKRSTNSNFWVWISSGVVGGLGGLPRQGLGVTKFGMYPRTLTSSKFPEIPRGLPNSLEFTQIFWNS